MALRAESEFSHVWDSQPDSSWTWTLRTASGALQLPLDTDSPPCCASALLAPPHAAFQPATGGPASLFFLAPDSAMEETLLDSHERRGGSRSGGGRAIVEVNDLRRQQERTGNFSLSLFHTHTHFYTHRERDTEGGGDSWVTEMTDTPPCSAPPQLDVRLRSAPLRRCGPTTLSWIKRDISHCQTSFLDGVRVAGSYEVIICRKPARTSTESDFTFHIQGLIIQAAVQPMIGLGKFH